MTDYREAVLACPKCRSTSATGLNIRRQYCGTCDTHFFELDGMPCWFPAGVAQKYLWEDLLAKFIEHGTEAEKAHLASLSVVHHLPSTRRKLSVSFEVSNGARHAIVQLLRRAGLRPQKRGEFDAFSPTGLFQYFELMLRDWSWSETNEEGYRSYQDENAMALISVRQALEKIDTSKIERILVIGSGAGRLSWDLHRDLQPALTLALDKHPLLAYVSKLMVRDGVAIELPEMRLYPHRGLGSKRQWTLRRPTDDDDLQLRWQVMAADVWTAPLKPQSFDLVLTPWFMDINGRDSKDLIAVVERLLKRSGYWLNYGPFLYPEELPDSQKYTPEEFRELLRLSRFNVCHEHFASIPYTWSPLSERGRTEEVWTFLAQSAPDPNHLNSAEEPDNSYSISRPPPWMILPHLPIPAFADTSRFPDALRNITALMDGTRSINEVAEIVAPNLPDDVSAKEFVYDFFKEYLLSSR